MAKDLVPLAMAEHEAIGKVRKAAVDSINAVTVAVLTNTADLERCGGGHHAAEGDMNRPAFLETRAD